MREKLKDLLDSLMSIFFGITALLNDGPQICIDNYTSNSVKIYLNNEHWKDVRSSDNFDFGDGNGLKLNSLNNEFYEIDQGDYLVTIRDYNGNMLEELKIQTKDNEYYILNVLSKVLYEDGYTAYGRSAKNSRYTEHSMSFFNAGEDYHFKKPPSSVYVRSGDNYPKRDYIKRIQVLK
jgi:hypothetical protein